MDTYTVNEYSIPSLFHRNRICNCKIFNEVPSLRDYSTVSDIALHSTDGW